MSATIRQELPSLFQWSNAPVNLNLGQPGYTTTAYPWIDPNELRLTIPTTGNVNFGQGPRAPPRQWRSRSARRTSTARR